MSFTQSETLRAIQALEVTSGHPRVALRLIELTRDSEVGVDEYAEWIEKDPSLTSRILSIVNSAWYAPETPILTVQRGLCTLGMSQVRTIALSHCVAGLHQAMALQEDDARQLWSASLCKGIIARRVAESLGVEDPQQAYVAGMLQDIGLALLQSLDRDAVAEIHGLPQRSQAAALEAERKHFGLDHLEAGARMARKLGLPELYQETIANHHGAIETGPSDLFTIASLVAATLPHSGDVWSHDSTTELKRLVDSHLPGWRQEEALVEEVQDEFHELDERLGSDGEDGTKLLDALIYASQENAKAASATVAQNIGLREDRSHLHRKLTVVERAHLEAEQRADRDPLTQLFNRGGWDRRARVKLSHKGGSGNTLGVAFFDLDHFKELNDQHGHAAGDALLKEIGVRMQAAIREEDLICRWGGDEFVILFCAESPANCLEAAQRVKEELQSAPVHFEGVDLQVSVTVGFVSIDAERSDLNLGDLLQIADEQLYKAKSLQRGTLSSTQVAS